MNIILNVIVRSISLNSITNLHQSIRVLIIKFNIATIKIIPPTIKFVIFKKKDRRNINKSKIAF